MKKVTDLRDHRTDFNQLLDPRRQTDLQTQIDDLARRIARNRSDIDNLETRVDVSEARQDRTESRLDLLEASAVVDRELLTELRTDWVFSQERAARMERALQSSRMIGAAIGIVMAKRNVTPEDAFKTLSCASQNSNVKLRDLAAKVVETGDLSQLPRP